MPEGFSVKPHYVSGFGELMAAEAGSIGDLTTYSWSYAMPGKADYTGLMSALHKPVKLYVEALHDRIGSCAGNSRKSGQELIRTAWVYLDSEEKNTGKFDGTGTIKLDEDAEKYKESDPKLPKLTVKDQVDLNDLFPQLGGMAIVMDWFVVQVLGWSFYNDVIDRMLGNWNALEGAGNALVNIGKAAETIATSMKEAQEKLDEHWDGGAAQKCEEYVTKLREALAEEGPLNRVVGELLKLIATEAEGVIADILSYLMIPFEELWDQLGSGILAGCPLFIPEEMIVRATETAKAYDHLFNYARDLVGGHGRAVDGAAEFIGGLENLVGMADKFAELEDQIGGFIKGSTKSLATAKDLEDLADSSEFDDAPDDPYSSGKDPERDGK